MFKHTIIILFISLIFASVSQGKNTIINELELIESLKTGQIIDQRQYREYISRLSPQALKSSVKALGGMGKIKGHIQDVSALNLINHDITLYEVIAGDEFSYVASEVTDVDGNYSFLNLQAGTYLVLSGSQIDDYLNYRWQSDMSVLCTSPYNCVDTTTSHIVLADAATINNIDFTVESGGQIHGQITDVVSMDAVRTLAVRLVNTAPNNFQNYSLFSEIDALTGAYLIKGIPDGNYHVYLNPLTLFLASDNLHIPQILGGSECNNCARLVFDGTGIVLSINTANTH